MTVGSELLAQHVDLSVIGSRAHISADEPAELWHSNGIRVQTLPRTNQEYDCRALSRALSTPPDRSS